MMWLSEPGETTPDGRVPGLPTTIVLAVDRIGDPRAGHRARPLLDLADRAAIFIG